MSSDEILGTVMGVILVAAVIGLILFALFKRPTPKPRMRSRTTFVAGIDDTPVDGGGGDGGGD